MLGIHPGARDFHHAFARNNSSGDEGPLYFSLLEASAEHFTSNCYILGSSTDPTWLIVCGKYPSAFDEHALDEWFRDVRIVGRIDKQSL
ncbi:MAG: hypothetical protein WA888_03415 [Burkholderiaceae bacterium]